jgi:hypothetical protein
MDWQIIDTWLNRLDLSLLGAMLFGSLCVAAAIGTVLARARGHGRSDDAEVGQEGYIVSAVLGLLALLLGFTFSMSVDRYDARRVLVLEEANAIGTTYLRAQLLAEPHRARMSDLLVRYTDNRIDLAKAAPGSTAQRQLLQANDALITDMWAAASAAFETIKGLDFSSTYLDSVNAMIDLDAARKTARAARVPTEVFGVLFVYMFTAAGVLGYVLRGARGRIAGGFLLTLLTLSLILTIDINRPVLGSITESQRPMEELRGLLAERQPAAFDKWRTAPVK